MRPPGRHSILGKRRAHGVARRNVGGGWCRGRGGEACAQSPGRGSDVLAAVSAEAWALVPPAPHERKWVLRSEAGLLLDKLLSRCARGRGALDVAVGEGLAAMAVGDRVVRLGFSGIGDYA